MDAGAGVSTGLVAEAAARDAARQAMERLGTVTADFAFLFASHHYREKYPELLAIVNAVTGANHLIGCGASGVLAPDGEFEGVPAVVVLAVKGPGADPLTFLSPGALSAGAGGGGPGPLGVRREDGGLVWLLPDASRETPADAVRAMDEATGGVPIIGGAAAGDPSGLSCWAFQDGHVASGGVAGALLRHPGTVLVGVTTACRPVGRPWTVTKAEGNLLHEIGGQPAAAILTRVLAEIPPGPHGGPSQLLLGVATDPAKHPLAQGDFLIRHILRVDAETGMIAASERIMVGQTVQFHVLDPESARADLLMMLTRIRARLQRARPRFGLYVNCASRGQALHGRLHHDVEPIRESLGEFPLAGFFGQAELAPVNTVNCVHRYSGVLTVFA